MIMGGGNTNIVVSLELFPDLHGNIVKQTDHIHTHQGDFGFPIGKNNGPRHDGIVDFSGFSILAEACQINGTFPIEFGGNILFREADTQFRCVS